MKSLFLLYTTILFSTIAKLAQAQDNIKPDVKQLIDTTIALMQEKSVNAKKVDWVKVKQTALLKAAHAATPYQAGNAMRYLMQSVNDFHGAIFYRDSTFRYASKPLIISDSVRQQWNSRAGIKTAMLSKQVGYIKVPSMVNGIKSFYDSLSLNLNDSLCRLLSQKTLKGLVIDLRINGGGAMYPMILGLEPLLGQGRLGSFRDKKNTDLILKNHAFLIDTAVMTSINPNCNTDATKLPVALVINSGTGSSGEFLAMTFKGRKNTIFVGELTAGFTTIIGGYKLSNDAYIYLSVGYATDRNGHLYTEAIKPDIAVSGTDMFKNLQQDVKIAAALKWIEGRGR